MKLDIQVILNIQELFDIKKYFIFKIYLIFKNYSIFFSSVTIGYKVKIHYSHTLNNIIVLRSFCHSLIIEIVKGSFCGSCTPIGVVQDLRYFCEPHYVIILNIKILFSDYINVFWLMSPSIVTDSSLYDGDQDRAHVHHLIQL